MNNLLFVLLGVYFVIGAFAIARINRFKEAGEREGQWLKYFVYLFLAFSLISLAFFYRSQFFLFSATLALAGLIEIFKVNKDTTLLTKALIVYVPVAGLFLFFTFGSSRLLSLLYFIVLIFDGFSQITGQLFGKRKLSPVISPNKTLEGTVGGVCVALLSSLILYSEFHAGLSAAAYFVFILVICFSSLAGDLLASWYKRLCAVKDYGRLIPGHGGVLDRFDSFIASGAAAGACQLIFHYFNK